MIHMDRKEAGARAVPNLAPWGSMKVALINEAGVLQIHPACTHEMAVQFYTWVSFRFPMPMYIRLTKTAARAQYTYQAAIPEELGFVKNDYLAVLRHQDDGWWEAEVHNGNGRIGLVPSNYLQPC